MGFLDLGGRPRTAASKNVGKFEETEIQSSIATDFFDSRIGLKLGKQQKRGAMRRQEAMMRGNAKARSYHMALYYLDPPGNWIPLWLAFLVKACRKSRLLEEILILLLSFCSLSRKTLHIEKKL
ncbi:hypothetical protein O6H91_11G070000 [Diphasiastrum complanatum]|uniref:Uncharacterized protein n=1 Tax=Diphasiastrum complanatum TaxID=34168 RepID=A0ACC2CAA5_DIPCM|nr:hypothetical protein O6H91_11G070000 [Diphasiastrum complanatum]